MLIDIQVSVGGFEDSDARERAELALGLRQELLRLDVSDVRHVEGKAAPNTKGISVEWAEMIVHGVTAVPALVGAIIAWTKRHRGADVSLSIDGDSITLGNATTDERRQLLAQWMERHGS